MVPESAFTEEVKTTLPILDLTLNMVVAAEWMVRNNADPDELELVCVFAAEKKDQLEAACSCLDGTRDLPCAHALAVLQEVRRHDVILKKITQRQTSPVRAA